jgi:hypothetical protein
MINLQEILEQKLVTLQKQLKSIQQERNSAATPIESRSDQTRSLAEQLHSSLQRQYNTLEHLGPQLLKIPLTLHRASLNTLVTLVSDKTIQCYLLVPDGLGGDRVGKTILLSIASPLAQQFLNQSVGFKFTFNSVSYVIDSIVPNQ